MLLDVNVLVNAMREDASDHARLRAYVDALRRAPEPFGVSELVLSATLRVLTHPRIFTPPTPLHIALDFVDTLRRSPNAVVVSAGARHWEIFIGLIENSRATGNLIADAWHAALAIEHGCEWISDDADFARFAGLRWRRPS